MLKKIVRYIKLTSEIKEHEKVRDVHKKYLDFLYSFEIVETNSWFDDVNLAKSYIRTETAEHKKLNAARDMLFGRRA
jgi:hypothetical protein